MKAEEAFGKMSERMRCAALRRLIATLQGAYLWLSTIYKPTPRSHQTDSHQRMTAMSDLPEDDLAEDEIEVKPTKRLFVDMLTRDIPLNRAVIDLVDNSVDGARRLRPGSDSDLGGLEVEITLNANEFRIVDNCGGIGIELARRYAFRIGRPKEMPATPNSVGQFGVGMKRAMFKFGREFEVISTTSSDRFNLFVNVDEWELEESWRFKFRTIERDLSIPLSETGTEIIVRRLRDIVAAAFSLTNFRISLSREIQTAQQQYIDRGLRIVFDGRTLIATPWQLVHGNGLEPAKVEETVQLEGGTTVIVRIFAGLGESSPPKAGWYVFCNGRMILEADQSATTGWAALANSAGVVIPKYHNQFARFRGYVFFDSANADVLPWNTTKSGVDQDSALYQLFLLKMIDVMRPIVDFLNDLDRENDEPESDRPLTQAISRASALSLRDIVRVGPFVRPRAPASSGPAMVSIQYRRPRERSDDLQDALGVSSAKQVGEQSFDLAYARYVEEK